MIICYFLMLVSFVLMTITGLQGLLQFTFFSTTYQQFALFATILYMFSQTLIMFYFIGSGTAIKKEINNSDIGMSIYEKVKKTKMILFPHLTLNMLIMGIAVILIGAVDTGASTNYIQSTTFILGYFHFLYTIKVQHVGFKENIDVIIELAEVKKVSTLAN